MHAGSFQSGSMDKHVFAAIVGRDKAKTLGRIEELNGTDSHRNS
jgi:hypothetical protein